MKAWQVIIVGCLYGTEILGTVEAEDFETALKLAHKIYDDGGPTDEDMTVRPISNEVMFNINFDLDQDEEYRLALEARRLIKES